jgi:hypothetical protein
VNPISVLETAAIVLLVTARTPDGAGLNPLNDTVNIAVVPTGNNPASTDWIPATWDQTPVRTDPVTGVSTYAAICYVGPNGASTFTADDYDIWGQVIDHPAIPTRRYDSVTFY